MPVKICHQPCNSRRNESGMPIVRFACVSQEQVKLSIFQMTYPEIKITICTVSAIDPALDKDIIPEPHRASLRTSFFTAGSSTRWLMIERVLVATRTTITPNRMECPIISSDMQCHTENAVRKAARPRPLRTA